MTEPSDRRSQAPAGMSTALMPAGGVGADESEQIARFLVRLVSQGAALGWVEPPGRDEIAELLSGLASAVVADDARVAIARDRDTAIVGLAYWTRYTRPTHRPHVDVEKVAVDPRAQGAGVGRELMRALITSARDIGVEVMTLDLREDNAPAIALYRSLGFERYGVLKNFVAVGDRRFDKHLFALDLRN